MQSGKEQSAGKEVFLEASVSQRLWCAVACAAIVAGFILLRAAAVRAIDLSRWLGVCGFKQRWGLPCPTCGMTHAALAFVRGNLWEAFYLQPAAAVICALLAAAAVFAFFTAVTGVYFRFLKRLAELNFLYFVLLSILLLAGGWAVTLARALSGR